jgi:alkylation response protein AidB-like acyl-CoA dehydrogenase
MIPNQEQAMIRDMARAFAQEKIAPFADQWARDGRVPQAVLDEMGQLGLMGMTIAEDHGGAGTDMVSYALALMEIAAGDGGLSTIMSVNNSPVCAAIAGAGNAKPAAPKRAGF